jgi:methionyl-tRNA formyltransferase
MIEDTLLGLVKGFITPIPQPEDGVCIASKLKKEECLIDWNKSAQSIHNLVRGVYKCPGAYFIYNDKIIKVLETEPLQGFSEGSAGDFIKFSKEGIDVKTGEGILRLIKVKPEGKGEMLARDWANGIKKG